MNKTTRKPKTPTVPKAAARPLVREVANAILHSVVGGGGVRPHSNKR